jgi:hypothetical protein
MKATKTLANAAKPRLNTAIARLDVAQIGAAAGFRHEEIILGNFR